MKGYEIGFLTAKDQNKLSQMYAHEISHQYSKWWFGMKTPLQEYMMSDVSASF